MESPQVIDAEMEDRSGRIAILAPEGNANKNLEETSQIESDRWSETRRGR